MLRRNLFLEAEDNACSEWQESGLELVVVSEDGVVQSVCEQPVFGSIKDLRVLPWNGDFRGSHPEVSVHSAASTHLLIACYSMSG